MAGSTYKPGTVGATATPTGAVAANGAAIKIKVGRIAFRGDCPHDDDTGDGDDELCLAAGMPIEYVAMNGWMLARGSLANFGAAGPHLCEALLTNGEKLTFSMYWENYRADWARRRGNIPFAVSGRVAGRITESAVSGG